MICKRAELSLDLTLAKFNRTALIIAQNSVLNNDTGHHTDQKYNDKKDHTQTL